MRLSRIFGRRAGYNLAAAAMLLSLVAPVLSPAFASAAQLTQRSIQLSSSSAGATGVTYTVNFTAASAAQAIVIDFCSNSPIVGQTCSAPAGFSAAAAASTTTNFTSVTGTTNKVVIGATAPIAADDDVSIVLTGINNPTSSTDPLYARIITYNTTTAAATTESAAASPAFEAGADAKDNGGVAIGITNTVGVSGQVLETMTFCVSGATIAAGCTGTITPPTLKLGQAVGDSFALDADDVSSGTIYTQISTNAVSGAILSLKSNANGCGGLLRAGAPGACDIVPAPSGAAPTGGITAGQARFGVKTGTAVPLTGEGITTTGTIEPVSASGYGSTAYLLNYASNNSTGVTSPYGDPFLDTNNVPVSNVNMPITFGASVSNSTPAGTYSADLNLVATGKF